MVPFEYIPPAKTESTQQQTLLLFDQLFDERYAVVAKEPDFQLVTDDGSKNLRSEVMQGFGAISNLDLPRGFLPEKTTLQSIGGVEEKVYKDVKDGHSTIVSSLLRFPATPASNQKIQDILERTLGPLNDSERSECSIFLAKFGDNQYKEGNSVTGYGSQWSAPSYFVRKMEVVEIDGRKVLMVDGAYTPPPWTPKDGLDKAESRFSAAFFIAPGGVVQTVYLEGKPENYKRHENAFVQTLKRAKF